METKMMELAMRIKKHREMRNISPVAMAEKTGVSLAQYNAYERGREDYSFTFLYACSKVFGLDIAELMAGERFTPSKAENRGMTIRQRNQANTAKKTRNLTLRP